MSSHRLPRATALVAVVLLAGVLVGGLRPARAQEATPHPAHLQRGTCAAPGEVLAPLADAVVGGPGAGGTPTAAEMPGMATTIPVASAAPPSPWR